MRKAIILAALLGLFLLAGWVEKGMAITANQQHNIMSNCKVATGTRTRVSWKTNQAAANRCYNNTIAAIKTEELRQSIINLNNAEASFLRDRTRLKNRGVTR